MLSDLHFLPHASLTYTIVTNPQFSTYYLRLPVCVKQRGNSYFLLKQPSTVLTKVCQTTRTQELEDLLIKKDLSLALHLHKKPNCKKDAAPL